MKKRRTKDKKKPKAESRGLSEVIVESDTNDRLIDILEREQLPSDVKSTLRNAINGSMLHQGLLFDAMLDTWPRLQTNMEEVSGKVSKAKLKVEAFALDGENPSKSATEKAKLVEQAFMLMSSDPLKEQLDFKGLVEFLSRSFFTGHGVPEIVWNTTGEIIYPKYAKPLRWRNFSYPYSNEMEDRLMLDLEGDQSNLIDFPKYKFLFGIRKAHSGHASIAAPLRSLSAYWLASTYGWKWLMSFCQLFGQPIRWATYNSADGKQVATKMLANMGSNPWAVVPEGTQINIASGTTSAANVPQAQLIDIADKACDIYILGQSLTTDSGKNGSRSLGEVHGDVRIDKLQSVADHVSGVLNQFSKNIIELNYGDPSELPIVSLEIPRPKDEKGMVERDKTLFVDMGLPVSADYLYDRHSISKPEEGDILFSPGNSNGVQGDPATGLYLPHETKKDQEDNKKGKVKAKSEKSKSKSNLDNLTTTVMENLTKVSADWLGSVKPFFDKLSAKALSENVSDEDFIATLEAAKNELPELFDDLDSDSLAKALEEASATALIAGVDNKLDEFKKAQ